VAELNLLLLAEGFALREVKAPCLVVEKGVETPDVSVLLPSFVVVGLRCLDRKDWNFSWRLDKLAAIRLYVCVKSALLGAGGSLEDSFSFSLDGMVVGLKVGF